VYEFAHPNAWCFAAAAVRVPRRRAILADVRVLVIGAGIAGLTLAGRLCQQGRPPVIVERAVSADSGYAIGLYPLGSCVLHGIGAYEELARRAVALQRYELASTTGRVLQSFDMTALTAAAGPLHMVTRAELLGLLEPSCRQAELRRGVMVASLAQAPGCVTVTFDDASEEEFDAVVGCDGAHSRTRDLVSGPAPGFETGWLLWTWWAVSGQFDPVTAREWWGPGCFFGVYPVPGQVMCAAGGPVEARLGGDVRSLLRQRLGVLCHRVPAVAVAIDALDDAHPWVMTDRRSRRWSDRRVALCGDSAVAFMPTAGVGASVAMRAAAGLGDELSKADAATVPLAFGRYEKRCRGFAQRAQAESRHLARAMFVRHPVMAKLRDQAVHRYPATLALRSIISSIHQPL
jgi:2-polyprenyl-6-methoxyphenol hydroxylase-like FAD-dependent oxidoreductase